MKLYKDHHGYHVKGMGLKLSFINRSNSGWTGFWKECRIRFLNDRGEFPRSYWASIGKKVHSKTVKVYQEDNQKNNIEHGTREP